MSLTSTSNRVVATGDAVTVLFNYNKLLYDADHLQVYLDAVLQTTGYTVSGVPGTSTSVTFASAPGSGVQVLFLRVVPLTQLSVYAVGGAFPAATTEKNFDLAMMALQQFDETLDRAVTLPITSTLTATDIPDPALPANYGLGLKIKGDGTGLDTFSLSATPYTSPLTTKGDLAVFSTVADKLAVGTTTGDVLAVDPSAAYGLSYVPRAQPNPIINGNMEIWQRGTTFAAAATGTYAADRYSWVTSGAGVVTINRTTDRPTVVQAGVLFNYSLEVDVTTADASIAAGDYYGISHKIEGYNWRHFAQRIVTLSFWVLSSKTGIHSVALRNYTADRSYVAEYTINVADTWEQKTVTITASPSAGAWQYTTLLGIDITWTLGAGTNSTTSSLATWNSADDFASTNQVNVLDNTANYFRLTGVKLELGSVPTPIQFVPFEEELARCQRYYQKSFPYATTPAQNAGNVGADLLYAPFTGTTQVNIPVTFQTRMRTAPSTVVTYNPGAANAEARNTTDAADDNTIGVATTERGLFIAFAPNAANTVSDIHRVHWTADAEL